MLVLTASTDKIQVVLGGAITTNQLQCFSVYRDITTSLYTPGRKVINTNSTTDIDLVDPPGASTQRVIDLLNIYNNDTVSATVTIKFDDNGTEYILWKGILAAGEVVTYQDGIGWIKSSALNSAGFAINVQALTSSPTDGQTVYFGMLPKAPVTTADTSKVYIPKNGRIKRAEIYCYSGTAGSNENWSLYVRINNTTDYLIATLGVSQSERKFQNAGLDIAVSAGDYFEIKGIQPTWGTNPATTIYGGYVYIE